MKSTKTIFEMFTVVIAAFLCITIFIFFTDLFVENTAAIWGDEKIEREMTSSDIALITKKPVFTTAK